MQLRTKIPIVAAALIAPLISVVTAHSATTTAVASGPLNMKGYCSFTSTKSYAQGTKVGLGVCNTAQASPATATPDHYLLFPGHKVQSADGNYYVWVTNKNESYEINSDGVITSRIDEQFKETAYGRTSNKWRLDMYLNYIYGREYEAFYDYYCGINISGGSDVTCDSWSGNSGAGPTEHGTMWGMGKHYSGTSSPFEIIRDFGSKSGTKFPMFNSRIQWSDGVHNLDDWGGWGWKNRGWDVCDTTSTTRLCNTTGNGQ